MAWELDDRAMDFGTILVACSHYMMICGSHSFLDTFFFLPLHGLKINVIFVSTQKKPLNGTMNKPLKIGQSRK
jgi:hypothetical protein